MRPLLPLPCPAAPRRRRPFLVASLLLLSVLLAGCGEPLGAAPGSAEPDAPQHAADEPVPRGAVLPGELLLDRVHEMRVLAAPRSNLPPRVASLVRRFVRGDGWTVEPHQWQGGEVVPEASLFRHELKAAGAVRRWRARAPFDLDLGLGQLWLRHEGRPLERGAVPADAADVLFWDARRRVLFGWEAAERQLVAYGSQAPGAVAYGYDLSGAQQLLRWERSFLQPDAPPPTAAERTGRVVLERVERTALAAPAPTTVALHVPRWLADGLAVGASVVDLGLAVADGRLVRAAGGSDGVVFAVQVQDDDGLQEVWSRFVAPGEAPVAETIDLSRYRGRPLTLRFVTRAGPDDDDAFDYALWTGLRATGTRAGPPGKPHLVLVDVDTLRADRLGCYGHARDTSPRLDAWAARHATVYTDCTAANNWTLPSTVSMLTGLSVAQHGVLGWPDRITPALQPLAQRLREAGYETYARTDGAFVGPDHGFSVGFDTFDFGRRPPDEHQRVGWRPELQWIASRASARPLFLFLQTYQVHEPYLPDRRFDDPAAPYDGPLADGLVTRERLHEQAREGGLSPRDREYVSALYDAGVRRLDDVLGPFLQGLEELWRDEPFVVIVTSDHGEELFERGDVGHGSTLHREQLAVPLLVRFPGPGRVGRQEAPASGLDLVPTLLDAAGLPWPDSLPGRSLLRPLPERRLRVAHHMDSAWAVQWHRTKLVTGRVDQPGRAEPEHRLFLLDDDPWERRDRAPHAPRLVERLLEQLADHERRYAPRPQADAEPDGSEPAPPPPELLEQLRALGYLGR